MSKKLIRLSEGNLHKIIKESVNIILKEANWIDDAENDILYRAKSLRRKPSHCDDYWRNGEAHERYKKNERLIQKATENMLKKLEDSRRRIQLLTKAIQTEEGKKLVDKYELALKQNDEITADKILKDIEDYNDRNINN